MHRRIGPTIMLAVICAASVVAGAAPGAAQAVAPSKTYLLRERLCLLQAYVESYANSHYSAYPKRGAVHRGSLWAPLWPLNPWTGRPMTTGAGIGNFSYVPSSDRFAYRLSATYPGGTIVLRGSVPDTRKKQYDHRSREGLELVQQYVEMWARDHGDLYPSVEQVDRWGDVGLQPGIPFWPRDPWFHAPMKQSTAWGEFTYDVSEARDAYSIAVHFSRGGGVALSGDTATNRWHQQRLALMDETVRRDLQIIHGIVALWSALHGGTLPLSDELAPGGSVGQSQDYWPTDPYSGAPFTVGDGLGHFTYTAGEGGAYMLSATLGASGAAPYVIEVTAPTPAP